MKKVKTFCLLYSVFCVLITSGCASIICGDSKVVNITSSPSSSRFVITDRSGIEVVSGTTPTNVNLKRGGGFFQKAQYSIEFRKEGYERKVVPIRQSVEAGWYFGGNFILGGLIGWFIVDPLTGAMWSIDDVYVRLNPLESILSEQGQSLSIKGYQTDTDPKTGKIITYPIYDEE